MFSALPRLRILSDDYQCRNLLSGHGVFAVVATAGTQRPKTSASQRHHQSAVVGITGQPEQGERTESEVLCAGLCLAESTHCGGAKCETCHCRGRLASMMRVFREVPAVAGESKEDKASFGRSGLRGYFWRRIIFQQLQSVQNAPRAP